MSKVTPIENDDRQNEIREIELRLFRSQDPFELIFKPEIEACLIFHPLDDDPSDGDYLTEEQYEAIVAASKHVGDTGFVLSHHHTNVPEYWWCEFPSYEDYRTTGWVGLLDTIMHSVNAGWGLLTAHESHTFVGGNAEFIGHVDTMYPAWRTNLMALVDKWDGTTEPRLFIIELLRDLMDEWKKWPGDDWVKTLSAKLDRKLTGGL